MTAAGWSKRRALVAVVGAVIGAVLPIALSVPAFMGWVKPDGALALVAAVLFSIVAPGSSVGAILGGVGLGLVASIVANAGVYAVTARVFTSISSRARIWRVAVLLGWGFLSLVAIAAAGWQL